MNAIALDRMRKPIFAGAVLLVAFEILVLIAGEAPLTALLRAAAGTWGTPYGAGQVLFKATPLLFAGLAFDLAARAKLFNIGAEGQGAVAALATGVVAGALPAGTPSLVAVPLCIVVAALAGALWASISGVLRAYFQVHEVIGTIMQNRLADLFVGFSMAHGLGATAYRTADAIPNARIPRLDRFWSAFHGSAASLALVLAIATAFAQAWFTRKTRVGREIAWVGLGEDACRAQGIPVASRIVIAMALSGGLAGLAATATVLGYKGYYESGLGAGAGFSGIAVALLGGGRPLRTIAAALFLGTLQQAGLVLNATVPKDIVDVLVGVCIVVVAASQGRR